MVEMMFLKVDAVYDRIDDSEKGEETRSIPPVLMGEQLMRSDGGSYITTLSFDVAAAELSPVMCPHPAPTCSLFSLIGSNAHGEGNILGCHQSLINSSSINHQT